MEFISETLSDYCKKHTDPESELLQRLNRETHLKNTSPRMLSGHLQGRFLSFISKLQAPQCILEIGTFTGYSALCLAEGLQPTGKLYTIDVNEETNEFARRFISASDYSDKIKILQGDALQLIPTLPYEFDLVFIDADKKNYTNYFDLVIDRVSTGGVLIADNVLWSGKVTEDKKDAYTLAIHNFNIKVNNDPRVEKILLPVRDGLMLMRKK